MFFIRFFIIFFGMSLLKFFTKVFFPFVALWQFAGVFHSVMVPEVRMFLQSIHPHWPNGILIIGGFLASMNVIAMLLLFCVDEDQFFIDNLKNFPSIF